MTNCQACGIEIPGAERYCRNCGAPVAASLEDLNDTRQFDPAAPRVAVAGSGAYASADQFYTGGSTTSQLANVSAPLARLAAFIRILLRKKLLWLAIFLLVSVTAATGLVVARDIVRSRRAERAEQARWAEQVRQKRQVKQAEIARRSLEESVRNALGFKPAAVSTAEYPDVQGMFVASLTSDYSPAALSPIQAGDVLTELNGTPIPSGRELGQVLDSIKPGTEVGVKLYRDGTTVTSTIRVADKTSPPVQPKVEPRNQGFLGLGDVTRRCCAPGTKSW